MNCLSYSYLKEAPLKDEMPFLSMRLSFAACGAGWHLYNGFCYYLFYNRYVSNWEYYRRICLAHDAEIASIRTPSEQAFVMSYLTQVLQTTYHYVYIGLTATNGELK